MSVDLNELVEYINLIPEFQPVVRKVIDGLKAYEAEYDEITNFVIERTVANKVKMYKAFQDAGIKDDHALALVVGTYQDFKETIKSAKIGGKKADK